MNALKLIDFFYPDHDPAKKILLQHSILVRDKAMQILDSSPLKNDLNREIIANGALLHDIGIRVCHAPDIGCYGDLPYLAHGIAGAKMLREYDPQLEIFARICERHTGTGLTAAEIRARALPLPVQDFLPETPEEKLVCLADKFFSKSADLSEKPFTKVYLSISKFGTENIRRFHDLCRLFGIKETLCS